MRKIYVLILAALFFSFKPFDSSTFTLSGGPFTQNWANTGLITVDDNWTGVPSIQGFRGDGLAGSTGVNPQTILAADGTGVIDVNANLTNPNTFTTGGVSEFHIANPVVALQGSGTARAPYIKIYLNTTGSTNINVQYNLRDIDGSADNAVQPVALQYRVGSSGTFTNIPAAFVADASTGPSLATLVTAVNVTLPAACENQSVVELRIMTSDAVGSDEWIGIDDIAITGVSSPTPILSVNDVSMSEGNAGTTNFIFTVSLSSPAGAGGVTFDIASQDNTATIANGDYTSNSLAGQTIAAGNSSYSFTVLVNGDGIAEPNETFFVNVTNVVGANTSDLQGTGTIVNDDLVTIAQIQGSANTSPFVGETVITSGIITGIRTNGFFMQTPDVGADADPNTSEGIFVFTGAVPPPTVVIGNNLRVAGTVTEFIPSADPNSPSQTEITSPSVTILSTGNPLPVPFLLTSANTDPAGSLYQLEKFESMRVRINSMTVVAPTQGIKTEPLATSVSNGFFYGVISGVARPFREPGIALPDPLPPGAPITVTRWDANPELIGVGSNSIGGPAIDVATGAILTNVVGPLDYRSRAYTIDIDPAISPVVSNNGLTFTAVPAQTADELTVATFNMERFYDDINDPVVGDVALTTTAYNNRLNKVSLAIRNVLRTPDIIGVVEVEKLVVLQAIATKVNNDAVLNGDPNPNYVGYLVEGNDVGGIDVGFLVKSARVNVASVIQYGLTTTYTDPTTGLQALLNDRPPLVLNGTFTKPGCTTTNPITVIVNHLRSLNGIDDVGSNGTRVRAKRKAQAEFLANLIQGFQTTDPTANIISVGDYNAFQFSDGYVDMIGTIKGTPTPASQVVLSSTDLVNPDLTDLVDTYTSAQRYSYSFSGSAQVLDHILVNQNALNKVSRFSIARLDADFPEIYRNDPLRPERISDHDAPVAYILFTDVIPPTASCKPATITLSNGTATITPSDIDNGSTDECGTVTLSVSPSQFDCSNIGANNVTLTVMDAAGNTSTCMAVVTVVGVIPSCTITAIPSNNIYTGGIPTNIYLGYGPQSVTLNVTPSGGAPFSYSWSGSNLSCTNCAAPVFTPTAEGVYNFTVTVTNTYGCTTTCSITICVLDIRVPGTNGKKVYLCHATGNPNNSQTLAISTNAVAAHLANHSGDKLGQCGQDPCSAPQQMIITGATKHLGTTETSLQVSVLPNPSSSHFILTIESMTVEPVSIRITDVYGREVGKFEKLSANSNNIRLGSELKTGLYFAEIIQGTERKVFKLVKL